MRGVDKPAFLSVIARSTEARRGNLYKTRNAPFYIEIATSLYASDVAMTGSNAIRTLPMRRKWTNRKPALFLGGSEFRPYQRQTFRVRTIEKTGFGLA
jgi:hypothetical protein